MRAWTLRTALLSTPSSPEAAGSTAPAPPPRSATSASATAGSWRCPRSRSTRPGCPEVVDATGKWVLPGMVDIHTHYDVEVLERPGARGVGAPRRDDDLPRLVLAVDGARRRRGRRRPVRPGRGDPAAARDRGGRQAQELEHRRRVRRRAGVAPARAQPGRVHRPLRHAHRDHGPGPGDPQGGRAHQGRAEADGGDARRGARRRLRRDVRPAAALRQARRGRVPVPHAPLDVRAGAAS